MQNIIAILAGIIFGFGLALSQMIDRSRVLGFLDLAGTWDPTLLFVLGGAVGVTVITFRSTLRRSRPVFASQFFLPTKISLDRQLVIGSALFGVGWGIAGYCPGPAIASLILGSWNPVLFLLAMIVGSFAYGWISKSNFQPAPDTPKTAQPLTG